MTVALIDGDIIAYKSAIISSDIHDDVTFYDPTSLKRNIDIMVKDWKTKAKAGKVVICLSSEDHRYFRHKVYRDYKGNREERERPKALEDAYDHLRETYDCAWRQGLEADDMMGILSGSPEISDPVIVSIDKDMLTVPCKLLNPNKMKRPMRVREGSANRTMMLQALIGDSTDNYPGVPGIGPIRAEKLLNDSVRLNDMYQTVVEAFQSEKMALTMIRLARILRYDDYDDKKGKVKLWHPTNDVWMKASTRRTTRKKAASKPSTTSSNAPEESPVKKRSSSRTRSNTLAGTERKTRKSRKKTSRKPNGTSPGYIIY